MPTIELTARYLDAVERPASGLVRHWDSRVRGLVAHVQPQATTFYFQIDVKGKTKRINLGRYPTIGLDFARQAARKHDFEMRAGTAKELAVAPRELTLQDALDHYLSVTAASAQHVAYVTRALTVKLSEWLPLPLKAITGAMVRARHAELTPDGPVMADETMRAFRTVWNAARSEFEDAALGDCPTAKLEKQTKRTTQQWNDPPATANQPIRDLATWKAQVDRIINPVHREFYLFTLLTGCRRTEVATIRWEQINREEQFLHLPTTKNGREHYLPLSAQHFEIIDRLPRQSDYVFPDRTTRGPVAHPVHDEVPGTLHSLRHTFATVAGEIGVPKDQVSRLLNYSNGMASVTDRYIKVHVNSLRPFMEDIAVKLTRRTQTV